MRLWKDDDCEFRVSVVLDKPIEETDKTILKSALERAVKEFDDIIHGGGKRVIESYVKEYDIFEYWDE
jgi:hypothetical protein